MVMVMVMVVVVVVVVVMVVVLVVLVMVVVVVFLLAWVVDIARRVVTPRVTRAGTWTPKKLFDNHKVF